MKFLILLTSAFAIVASVNSIIKPKINFNELLTEVDNLLKSNPSLKDEILMTRSQIEIVQKLKVDPLSFTLKRRKRQATSVNCTALPIQLQNDKNEIEAVKAKIINATITQSTISKQVTSYQDKVKTATGSSLKTAQNLLSVYDRLLKSINTLLETLQKNLATLEANVVKIESEIQMYCVVTTAAPNAHSCGTFLPYDTKNLKTAPTVNGFAGGINFLDSSTTYVGFGNGATCSNQIRVPCALSATGSSPGCNIPCGPNQIYDGTTSFYLLSHSNLAWVSTNSASMMAVPNALRILGPENFMFGRALVNGSYLLGKVQAGKGVNAFQAVAASGSIQLTNGFEVLTCTIPGCSCSGSNSSVTYAPTQSPTEAPTQATSPTQAPTTAVPTQAPTTQAPTITPSTTKASTITPSTTKAPTNAPVTTILSLLPGGTLVSGQKIISSDGSYAAISPDGDLVYYSSTGSVIWSAGLTGAKSISIDSNGVLTVRDASGNVIKTVVGSPGSSLSIQNGQVVFGNGTTTYWSSVTTSTQAPTIAPTIAPTTEALTVATTEAPTTQAPTITPTTTKAPTNAPVTTILSLLPGGTLVSGQQLISSDGSYATISPDGDLVYYSSSGSVIWSAGLTGAKSISIDSNGVLSVKDSSGNVIKTVVGSPGSSLSIQNGQVVFGNEATTYWSSVTTTTQAPTIAPTISPTTEAPTVATTEAPTTQAPTITPTTTKASTNAPVTTILSLLPGGTLISGQKIISSDGSYAAISPEGDLVYYSSTGSVIWSAGLTGAKSISIDSNGVLSVKDSSGNVIKTVVGSPGSSLSIRNGQVVFGNGTTTYWSSVPDTTLTPILATTNAPVTTILSLLPGGTLVSGQKIISSDGSYAAISPEGDLVYYSSTGSVIWSAGLTGAKSISIDSNGVLSVKDSSGNVIKTVVGSPGSSLSIRNGQVVFGNEATTYWSSVTTTTQAPTIAPTIAPTTEAPTVATTEASVCNRMGNIVYQDGTIAKKVCLYETYFNHSSAESFCNSNGLQGLYSINNAEDFNQLKTFLTQQMNDIFGSIEDNSILVNGVKAANGTWYNSNTTLLYPGAIPTSGIGNYLFVYGTATEFITVEVHLGQTSWIVCEFNVTNIQPTTAGPTITPSPTQAPTIAPTSPVIIDPNSYQCGTFMKYDTVNQISYPISYGYQGGFDYDSTFEYVGYGNNPCGMPPQTVCPGYISTELPYPGAYMSCSTGLQHDNTNAYFLLYNSNLKWVDADNSSMMMVNYKLAINDTNYTFFFGRTLYNGDYRLGKVHAYTQADGLSIIDENNGPLTYGSGFQILTCIPPSVSSLDPGSSLVEGQKITSSDGSYMILTSTGNLVHYNSNGGIVWQSGTIGGKSVIMQSDGTLVIVDGTGKVIWSRTGTSGSSLQIVNGQVVLVNGGVTSWGSSTDTTQATTNAPVTTILSLLPGGTLVSGQKLVSSDGSYAAISPDGDLVYYSSTGSIIWSAGLTGAKSISIDSNGALTVRDATGNVIWTVVGSPGSSLSIQNGQVVFGDGSTTYWSSVTTVQSTPTQAPTIAHTSPGTIDLSTYPCGTFMKYDTFNQRMFPFDYGYQGGFDYDSTLVYVGYGSNTCGNPQQTVCPGFISTEVPYPGAYLSCSTGIQYDNANAYFLLKNSNLRWVLTNGASKSSVNYRLTVSEPNNVFNFGKVNYNGADRLGKIHANIEGSGVYFIDENNNELHETYEFYILTCLPTETTQAPTNAPVRTIPPTLTSLQSGGTLVSGQKIISSDGSYAAISPEGDLVYYSSTGNIIWSAGLTGAKSISIDSNGVLSVKDSSGNIIWSVNGSSGSSLSIQNGQIVFGDGSTTYWSSTRGTTSASSTNYLYPGESIYPGDSRISTNGAYQIYFQNDGNIVIKSVASGQVIWNSNTAGATKATMNADGSLVVYDTNGNVLFSSSTSVPGSRAYITNSGKLIVTYENQILFSQGGASYECGTFMEYDALNDRLAPLVDGFLAGLYADGSNVFVGIGNNTDCYGETLAPCRLSTNNPAGCYIPSCAVEKFENKTVYYLLNHPFLKWIPVTSATLQQTSGLIITNPDIVFKIARVNLTSYVTIGKGIHNLTNYPLKHDMYWYNYATQVEEIGDNYEILACVDPNACKNTLSSGQTLNIGDKICNGDYTMTLQADGNLVIKASDGTVKWSSETTGATRVVMEADGSFVAYDSNGNVLRSSAWYASSVEGSSAVLQSDGTLYIQKDGTASWSSSMIGCPDTLRPGQTMLAGESRTSCDGSYKMTMQADGNFVVSSTSGSSVLWTTETAGMGGVKAVQQTDGNFVILDANNNIVYQTATYSTIVAGSSSQILDNGLFIVFSEIDTSFVGRVRPQYTCGMFLSYDTVNDRGAPIIEGFKAGTYLDGSDVYVGYADNTRCQNQAFAPARIRANDPNAGAYVGRCGVEAYESNTAFFLQKNANLRWVPANSSTILSVPNAISLRGGTFTFLYARVTVPSGGTTYTQIGKGEVYDINNPSLVPKVYYYSQADGKENVATEFEILTCFDSTQTSIATTVPPITQTQAPLPTSCGSLIYYNTADKSLIESLGLTGGVHSDLTKVYAGVGNNVACGEQYCPARLSTSVFGPGAYMTCGSSQYDSQNSYFFRQHKDLYWIPTDSNSFTSINGRLYVNSTAHSLFTARKTLSNNYQAIGKIYNTAAPYNMYHIDVNGQEAVATTDFDVLVCDPNPACGTFAYFDAQNIPNDPIGKGFIGAVNKNGTNSYVGRGNNKVLGQYPCPGKVETGASAGVHMAAPLPYHDKYSAYYLLDHQDLHWIPTNKDHMSTLARSLKVKTTTNFDLSYGRIFVDNYAYLGKVHDRASLNYISENGQETVTQSFELLVCNPTLTYKKKSCANRIEAGRCLTFGEQVYSCYGCSLLKFQNDGNLVVYASSGEPIWAAGSQTFGATKACMQADGNFVVYNGNDGVIWSAIPVGTTQTGLAYAEIQDDGQLKVYLNGEVKFQSGTTHPCNALSCGNRIEAGRCLAFEEQVVSCSGCSLLKFQSDGNLVVYTRSGVPIWAAGSQTFGATKACMQADGNFVVSNANDGVIWSAFPVGTTQAGYGFAEIQDDGQFKVYLNGEVKFQSGSTHQCNAMSCVTRIEARRCLAFEEQVVSCNGCSILKFQADGNLVVYTRNGVPIWAAGSQTFGATKACMQTDGNFVVSNANDGVIWSAFPVGTTPAGIGYAEIQDDGQFKVYLNGVLKFQSGSTHSCSP